MKGVLIFLFVIVIAVVGFGFYRGWWSISSTKDADNKVHVDFTVDKEKLSEDEKAALKKVHPGEQTVKDAGTAGKPAATTATGAPGAAEKQAKETGIAPAVYQGTKK